MSEANARRAVFLLRFGIWSLVAVLAVVALKLRAAHAEQDAPDPGVQLNGATSQGMPIWARVEDGRVVTVKMSWRPRCARGGRGLTWRALFSEEDDVIERRDRGFVASHTASWPDRYGPPNYVESVTGVLAEDGRSATGAAHMNWTGAGATGARRCEAAVEWRARAG